MDCKHVDALLMDYLYQELEPSQAERVEAHLEICARCAGELSAYERTRAAVRELPELEPPAGVDDLLLREAAKAVRLHPEPAPGFWQRVRESLRVLALHPAMTAAVTLMVVLGVSFFIYRTEAPPSRGPLIDQPPPPLERAASERPAGGVAAAPALQPEETLRKNFADEERVKSGEERPGRALAEKREAVRPAARRLRAAREEQAETRGHSRGSEGRLANRRDEDERLVKGERSADKKVVASGTESVLAHESRPRSTAPIGGVARQEPSVVSKPDPYEDAPRLARGATSGKEEARTGQVQVASPRPAQKQAPTPKLAAKRPPAPSVGPAPAAEPAPERAQAQASAPGQPKPAKVVGTAGGGDLMDNVRVYQKAPRPAKRSKTSLASGVHLNAPASDDRPRGKAKQGQTVEGGKLASQSAGQVAGKADYWVQQGLLAQKRGQCSLALAYYERALGLDPKLAGKLAGSIRSCAATLNESALAEARKLNRRLSGYLNVEVARRARLRQMREVDLEAAGGKAGGRAQKRAAPAKAAPVDATTAH